MIIKILLTLILLTGLVLWVRTHSQRRGAPPAPRRPAPPSPRPPRVRAVLYTFVTLMLVATATLVYLEWEQDHRVVVIRVINTQNGAVSEYHAHLADVEGRSFETVDGRRVTLAEVERMEMDLKHEK